MDNILELKNISKHYQDFSLNNINLVLPKGCIMGFVGENGAGKSTTIKLMLNLISSNQGEINIFGLNNIKHEQIIKEDLGIVLDESNFPNNIRAKDINIIMKNIYRNWDEKTYKSYLEQFDIPLNKTLKEYSRGMKMKLSIAIALSHNAKLLILDEATSGLDPIIREEILDIFLEFIQDENHSVFISSHIISDLEKVADYIVYIHKGKIVFNEAKDTLLTDYCILKCSKTEFDNLDKTRIIGYRKSNYGVEALIKRESIKGDYIVDPASIEEIILFMSRGTVK